MWRVLLLSALTLVLSTTAWADDAQDAKQPAAAAAEQTPLEKLKANPDDVQALRTYVNSVLIFVSREMTTDPEASLKRLAELDAVAAELKPTTPASKALVTSMQATARAYRTRIKVQQTPAAELEQRIAANPDDLEAASALLTKAQIEIAPLVRSKPEEASKKLAAVKAILAKAAETTKQEATKTRLESFNRTFEALEKSIAAGEKLTKLIGQDAAPLKIDTWVNGAPLTAADLKGKVVFLDFWAIWCGPCIATFPHLKEWNEKYADKGLVMVGLTRYYNYKWDEETKKATRVDVTKGEKVSPEEEQAMLVKFAESYGLKHRFGIQPDSSLSDYYGVTGIPHVVVIDQQGKIRLMKVGSGDANAKEIGELLDKLLGSGATGGE